MQGILVVPPRRIQYLGSFRMGQEGPSSADVDRMVSAASVEQLVAFGRSIDAARSLVSAPFGRLISAIMVPIAAGMEAVFTLISHFKLPVTRAAVESRERFSFITSKVAEIEEALGGVGDTGKEIAQAILRRDPGVRSVAYRSPDGTREFMVLPREGRDVSLIVGNDLASIKEAAEKGREALKGVGYRLGGVHWLVTVSIVVALALLVIHSLIGMFDSWREMKSPPIENARRRIEAITKRLIEIDRNIPLIMDAISRLEAKKNRTEGEEEALRNFRNQLVVLQNERKLLVEEREFIQRNEEKIKEGDTIFDDLERFFRASVKAVAYLGIGLVALAVAGTIIHFVTR